MRILSALLSLFGLGGKSFEPASLERRAVEHAPHIDPETRVFHSGRHRNCGEGECPACLCIMSKRMRCLNRACFRFNGRLAHTHSDLLSLKRYVRQAAQDRWARGGMAALFAN